MSQAETWTIFDTETRLPLALVTCTESQLAQQVQDGQIAVKGSCDLCSTKLGENGEFELDSKQEGESLKEKKREVLLARLKEIDSRQHRRVRELLAESDEMLRMMEQEAAQLRVELADLSKQ